MKMRRCVRVGSTSASGHRGTQRRWPGARAVRADGGYGEKPSSLWLIDAVFTVSMVFAAADGEGDVRLLERGVGLRAPRCSRLNRCRRHGIQNLDIGVVHDLLRTSVPLPTGRACRPPGPPIWHDSSRGRPGSRQSNLPPPCNHSFGYFSWHSNPRTYTGGYGSHCAWFS